MFEPFFFGQLKNFGAIDEITFEVWMKIDAGGKSFKDFSGLQEMICRHRQKVLFIDGSVFKKWRTRRING